MLFTFKSSFYYFSNIKNDLVLSINLNMLSFKISLFIFIKIFDISFILTLDLHFVFKNLLDFLINAVVIILISFLLINIIIFFFSIDTFIIIVIECFIKYNTQNNFDFFFIMLINFLYLKYQFDKSLLNSYIRHLSS